MGLVAVLLLLQNGGLSGFLRAGTYLPNSCYYEGGCANAGEGHTAKSCDDLRGGKNHYSYFKENEQCLPGDEYRFNAAGIKGADCGYLGDTAPVQIDCLKALADQIKGDPCLWGQKVGWLGDPWVQFPYVKAYRVDSFLGTPSLNYLCDVSCTSVRRCVKGPVNTSGDILYVSIGDKRIPEEAGRGDLKLLVRDKNGNSVSNHGGITVTYHTQGGKIIGSATEGEDFKGVKEGTINIPNGSSSGSVVIEIINDSKVEGDELFFVWLDSARGINREVYSGGGLGIGLIIDDDVSATPSPTPSSSPLPLQDEPNENTPIPIPGIDYD